MCDCKNEKSVLLINIYLTMAEYKVNSKVVKGVRLAGKESVDFRTELSQEDLAYAYEDLNITDWIDKIDKSNEKSTSKKSKIKKSATITENSEEE
tara:strand:- start:5 stop:289 length:285 start_codon:yes stop_codon:yes gene_type:complete